MDPKSLDGKPPTFETLDPAFGAKLSEWVMRDMIRAKKARDAKKANRVAPSPDSRAPKK